MRFSARDLRDRRATAERAMTPAQERGVVVEMHHWARERSAAEDVSRICARLAEPEPEPGFAWGRVALAIALLIAAVMMGG